MMWILHILAIVFFIPALILTIPLHMIISRMDYNKEKTEKARKDEISELKKIFEMKV